MNDFSYAALTHILETRLKENAQMTLYVCTNKVSKKRFKRNNKDLKNAIVLTVDEIWFENKLDGLRYNDYRIIM